MTSYFRKGCRALRALFDFITLACLLRDKLDTDRYKRQQDFETAIGLLIHCFLIDIYDAASRYPLDFKEYEILLRGNELIHTICSLNSSFSRKRTFIGRRRPKYANCQRINK